MTTHAYGFLSAAQAADIAGRARAFLRAGRLTAHDYVVFDNILWRQRPNGRDIAEVSYSRIRTETRKARSTISETLVRLVECGLIQRIKRRVLTISAVGGRIWQQLTSHYRLISRESTGRTDSKKEESRIYVIEPRTPEIRAAQAVLAQRRAEIEARYHRSMGSKDPQGG